MKYAASIIAIATVTSIASADIARIGEFESSLFEGFQDLSMGTFESSPVSVFDGLAEIRNTGGSYLHTTGAWSYENRTPAFEGNKLLGNTRGGIEYSFSMDLHAFGGFFATIADVADGQISFFDGETLVGSDTVNATIGGEWSWNGWESDAAFDRVVVTSNYGESGGFIMHDAMRGTATIPAPGALALLGLGGLTVGSRRRK